MHKSDLEAKREAAAYTSDVGSSLQDSEISDHGSGSEFDADDIIAQRIDEEEVGDVLQYLVKFTDYPLHRAQWLSGSALSKELLEKWRRKRREMGALAVEHSSKRNGSEHKEAKEKADAAKQRRRQKREQLRQEAVRKDEESRERKRAAATNASLDRDRQTSNQNRGKASVSSERKRPIITSSSDDEAPEDMPHDESDSSDSMPLRQRLANSRATVPGVRPETYPPQQGSRPSEAENSFGPSGLEARLSAASRQQGQGPIKMINKPKEPLRKAWDTHGKHYNTLHFRGLAEKRGRMESTPDVNDLDFVNGHPAGMTQRSTNTAPRASTRDSLYGRREPGRRPEPVDEPDVASGVALQTYEEGKIPMACSDWKSGMCHYGAERCRFLHREHDQDGKLLPLTTWRGEVPPKYRNPPETCWLWFCEDHCRHPDEDCVYAHKNTGHLSTRDGRTLQINPRLKPGIMVAQVTGGEPGQVRNYPDVTCWHWLLNTKGCLKSPDECNFAHKNTGLLGNTLGAEFRSVDLSLKPICHPRSLPKFQDPPLTCFFWLRGEYGCHLTAERCKFAHENTGWLSHTDKTVGIVKIESNEKPKYGSVLRRPSLPTGPAASDARHRNRLAIPFNDRTCFFWNEYICKIPDGQCKFQHRYTGTVADAPRSWKRPPGWQPQSHFRREIALDRAHEPTAMDVRKGSLSPVVKPRFANSLKDEPESRSVSKSLMERHDRRESLRHVDRPMVDQSPKECVGEPDKPDPNVQSIDSIEIMKEAMPTDFDELFRCNGDQQQDVMAAFNTLLLYNPAKQWRCSALLEQWLSSHQVVMFSSAQMGLHAAWNAFKQLILDGGSGIIIASPDFEDYEGLPGFGDVLRGTVRLWSIGYQPSADFNLWDPRTHTEHSFNRLAIFPHGGVIYITDDVFERKPQLALAIFRQFIAKIEAARQVKSDVVPGMFINDGILLWRLGVRPELLKWIGDACIEHAAEIDEGDANYASLEELYRLLHYSGYCEPDGTFDRPADNRRFDFFPVMSLRQRNAEGMGLYYNARSRSQHEANTDMAAHYSAFVVLERRNYRHYFVVHTDPETVDWKETITTIDEVITPEKCLEYLLQEPKGSKFDNYEWSYPVKRYDSMTDTPSGGASENG